MKSEPEIRAKLAMLRRDATNKLLSMHIELRAMIIILEWVLDEEEK